MLYECYLIKLHERYLSDICVISPSLRACARVRRSTYVCARLRRVQVIAGVCESVCVCACDVACAYV